MKESQHDLFCDLFTQDGCVNSNLTCYEKRGFLTNGCIQTGVRMVPNTLTDPILTLSHLLPYSFLTAFAGFRWEQLKKRILKVT